MSPIDRQGQAGRDDATSLLPPLRQLPGVKDGPKSIDFGFSIPDPAHIRTGTHMAHEALQQVLADIAAAARAADRAPQDVHLVAVSKTFGADAIRPVLDAGQRLFGENRVQEAEKKWPELRREYREIDLHLIGPLQSNKTKDAVALFDAIHTVDRPKIAEKIAEEMQRTSKQLKLFIQVNTGEEAQKAGIPPAEATAFVTMCREKLGMRITGLMCIPPVDEEPAVHFALLAKLARENGLKELSMGMSADYTKAIQHGATYVRVGSAIFGARG
jgi:PLP dependent protein